MREVGRGWKIGIAHQRDMGGQAITRCQMKLSVEAIDIMMTLVSYHDQIYLQSTSNALHSKRKENHKSRQSTYKSRVLQTSDDLRW